MSIESKAVGSYKDAINYPCLMGTESRVVLFTGEGRGVIVWAGKGYEHKIGYYAEDWLMSRFSPFHGEISLTNKE